MNLRKAAVSLVMLVFLGAALFADDALPVVHYRPESDSSDASSASDAPAKAVSAVLVKSKEGDWPYEGNVQVTYSNGQTAVVTTDGRDSKPKVVAGGMVGWVNAVGHDEKYGSVKTVLLLRAPDGTVKPWECNAIFIEDWGLVDNDSHLVIRSMQHHGNDFFIEYDLKSGQTLNTIEDYVAYADLPKWAQPYANSSN